MLAHTHKHTYNKSHHPFFRRVNYAHTRTLTLTHASFVRCFEFNKSVEDIRYVTIDSVVIGTEHDSHERQNKNNGRKAISIINKNTVVPDLNGTKSHSKNVCYEKIHFYEYFSHSPNGDKKKTCRASNSL